MDRKFLYGVSTSAFQIEGDDGTQGRSESVWDTFCEKKGLILNGDNGKISADHYNNLEKDLDLLSELGVNSYRFSVSWPRVLPDGTGKVNRKGLDFYARLIDGLLKRGISPFCTFYHWDLPEKLCEKGGLKNPDFSDWFAEYAYVLIKNFGDRINDYITFNEPINCVHSSYYSGTYAPGERLNDFQILKCVHNLVKAHGKAAKIIDENVKDYRVGVAVSTFEQYPVHESEKCVESVKKAFFEREIPSESVDVYSDAIYLGDYPERVYEKFPQFSDYVDKSELKAYSKYTNVLCYNNYSGYPTDENGKAVTELFAKELTDMGSPIDPNGLYWGCKFLTERYKMPIIISENGVAAKDTVSSDGKVHDELRKAFFEKELKIKDKIAAEMDLKGYFVWSFLDNFEWLFGYSKRFGLVYVDFKTGKRIPKDSFYWIKNYIANNKGE